MTRGICALAWAGPDSATKAEHRCKLEPGHDGDCLCPCGAHTDLSYYRSDEMVYEPREGSRMLVAYLVIALVVAVIVFGAMLFRAIFHGGF